MTTTRKGFLGFIKEIVHHKSKKKPKRPNEFYDQIEDFLNC